MCSLVQKSANTNWLARHFYWHDLTGSRDVRECLNQPKSGALADKPLDHEKMEESKSYYYTLMGWDAKTGVPLKEKMEELLI